MELCEEVLVAVELAVCVVLRVEVLDALVVLEDVPDGVRVNVTIEEALVEDVRELDKDCLDDLDDVEVGVSDLVVRGEREEEAVAVEDLVGRGEKLPEAVGELDLLEVVVAVEVRVRVAVLVLEEVDVPVLEVVDVFELEAVEEEDLEVVDVLVLVLDVVLVKEALAEGVGGREGRLEVVGQPVLVAVLVDVPDIVGSAAAMASSRSFWESKFACGRI